MNLPQKGHLCCVSSFRLSTESFLSAMVLFCICFIYVIYIWACCSIFSLFSDCISHLNFCLADFRRIVLFKTTSNVLLKATFPLKTVLAHGAVKMRPLFLHIFRSWAPAGVNVQLVKCHKHFWMKITEMPLTAWRIVLSSSWLPNMKRLVILKQQRKNTLIK